MITLEDADRRRVLDLARKYLEPHQPQDGSYRLDVIDEAVRKEDEWYYVVVVPSRYDIRSYDYSSRLAEAEQDLQDSEQLKVLLVPAIPN
jgi:hypothetical protein